MKDTHAAAGWRTTYGSPLYADHVATHDDLIVERVRRAGVVLVGKTNVPEFAAGSHTFNTVFGTTRNPHDPSRSAGGSSGGAAAALASGMVPLADGSDMGGSLRNPASFCGVVGLRPSLGRVPTWPTGNLWETTSVGGPMARTVDDLALLLSVLAGPDPRVPLALGDPGHAFAPPVTGSLDGLRVGFTVDLGGAIAVDHDVAAVTEEAGPRFARGGARVIPAWPDLSLGDDTFRTLRAWHFQASYGALLAEHPDAFKQSLADNIRLGADLTGVDVARAYAQRTTLVETMRSFFERVRRARAARLAGPALPGRPGVPDRDQRRADGVVPRLDALGLPHHRHRLPGHLGARRHHPRRAARRRPDRRPARRRPPRLLEFARAFEAAGVTAPRRRLDRLSTAIPTGCGQEADVVENPPSGCG